MESTGGRTRGAGSEGYGDGGWAGARSPLIFSEKAFPFRAAVEAYKRQDPLGKMGPCAFPNSTIMYKIKVTKCV